MIRLGGWQYIKRIGWEPKYISPLDHVMDDFQFIWFPSDKPTFFKPVTMADLQYTRADRMARISRYLRLRERKGLE